MAGLDKGSPLPKYYQLKEIIREMIESQEFRAGEPIPPERRFCEEYGVSRMTTRQAIVELANEGLLYREQGRGTFVADRKVRQEAQSLTSFTDDMAGRGMTATSSVLGVEQTKAGPVAARRLGIREDDEIVRIQRVRNADGRPMALETSHLLREVAEGLLSLDLSSRSIYEALTEEGIRVTWAGQSHEATVMNEFEAGHLESAPGAPALLLERVTHDEADRAFEYVKSIYRGDRYRITAVLRP